MTVLVTCITVCSNVGICYCLRREEKATGYHGMLYYTYVVWQKSNETDFLLTMNFILFTNEGYPLQNSSLGQLHSDGDVVSIDRSSAGRLLLVYLSAHQLRSSGYYPKYQNGARSSGFWAGEIKRSHRDWDPANRGAEPKIHWWRLPCDMGRCRGRAS